MISVTRPDLSIDASRPWHDDKLKRQALADALTNLIANQEHPLVISLDGKWGTGKTFFLQRWHRTLKDQGYRTVYFNAWKDDFCDDPLIPMLVQIIENHEDLSKKKISDDPSDILYSNLRSVLNKFSGLQLPAKGDALIDAYRHQKKSIDRLRDALSKLLLGVQTNKDEDGELIDETETSCDKRPMVVIVDELDRCRPDFAVSVLERTKHIFNLPGLVFVYGVNRHDLHASIKSLYGKIDVDAYTRRFFDMDLLLPSVHPREFCRSVAEQYGLWSLADKGYSDLIGSHWLTDAIIKILPSIRGLSLRDIEHCIRIMAIVGKNIKHHEIADSEVVMAIVLVRILDYGLYRMFVENQHVAGQMITLLRESSYDLDERRWLNIQGWLYYACDSNVQGSDPAYGQLMSLREGKKMAEPTLLSDYTKQYDSNGIESLIKKIRQHHDLSDMIHGEMSKTRLLYLMELAPK